MIILVSVLCGILLLGSLLGRGSGSRSNGDWLLWAVQIPRLAMSTPAEDIMVYTTAGCYGCTTAKTWLRKNHFRFKECDVEVISQCREQMHRLGGEPVPFVVIRGHPMDVGGFSRHAFVSALSDH